MEHPTWYSIAGFVSSGIFTLSYVPMLRKAFQTKDLSSYSFWNMLLVNIGNVIHWIYISSLPFGPIWFLHAFYTITTVIMLVWYVRFRR